MPYGAFGCTVTTPLCDGLGLGRTGDDDDELAGEEAAAAIDAGTEVASVPSSTSTWPAATVSLAFAVTPVKYPAIFAAFAAAPVP